MRRISRFGCGDGALGNELLCQCIGLWGSSEKLERVKHSQSVSSGFRVTSGAFIGNKA